MREGLPGGSRPGRRRQGSLLGGGLHRLRRLYRNLPERCDRCCGRGGLLLPRREVGPGAPGRHRGRRSHRRRRGGRGRRQAARLLPGERTAGRAVRGDDGARGKGEGLCSRRDAAAGVSRRLFTAAPLCPARHTAPLRRRPSPRTRKQPSMPPGSPPPAAGSGPSRRGSPRPQRTLGPSAR